MFFITIVLFGLEWLETTQEDFRDGGYERNLYSSHRGDGAIEFSGRFDLNNDGYIDLAGNAWIMWGAAAGLNQQNITEYNGQAGCDAADLNTDGYPDFVTTGINNDDHIFWGNPDGPDTADFSTIPVTAYNNEGVMAADFNKDGWLDLLASKGDDESTVFWGAAAGFSQNNSTSLYCHKPGYNPEVADLNKDGWLDVIVLSGEDAYEYIYWGGPGGFSGSRFTKVIYDKGGPHGISVADLNYDGWLDIVYSGNYPNYGAVLWGSADKYRSGTEVNVDLNLPLRDRAFGGSSIADLNEDGYLDIVFFGNDDVPPRIFWGDQDGISPDRRSDLGAAPSVGSGGVVADFTNDGHLDIVELTYDGTILFQGPGFTSYQNVGPFSHHGFSREIGNVYSRVNKEEYFSSIFDAGVDASWSTIHWEDSCPGNSMLKMAVRVGDTPDTSSGWSDWVTVQNDTEIPGSLRSRYIQYRATFEYPNPAYLPVLFLVGIEYLIAEEIIVRPDRQGSGFPGDTVSYNLEVLNYTYLPDVIEISSVFDNLDWFHETNDSLGNPLGDFDTDLSPDVGELDAGGDSTRLLVKVGIPDSPSVSVDTMIVFGRSSNPSGLYDSAIVVTYVLAPVRILVDPNQDTVGWPGQTLYCSLWGINYGKDPDVIDLVAISARGWQVQLFDSTALTPLEDNDADFIPDLGPVPARSGRRDFKARINIPDTAIPYVSDTVRIVGISSQDTAVTDLAILIIQVLPPVWIEVEPDQDTFAVPGQSVLFSLWEANHGRWDDVIDLKTWSMHGWQVELLDSAAATPLRDNDTDGLPDVGEVPNSGERRYFSTRIKVPANAIAGETDTVYIIGTSSQDTTVKDLATLIINPVEISLLEIRPDQKGSVSPDMPTVRYTLEAINHGNVADIGAITTRSHRGWDLAFLDSTGRNALSDSDADGVPDVGKLEPIGGLCTLYVDVSLPEEYDPTRGSLDTISVEQFTPETTVVYISSASSGVVHDSAVIVTTALPSLTLHNFPNPFREETHIVWSQPEDGNVTIRIADRAARPVGNVFNEYCNAGVHSYLWRAASDTGGPLAPGIYIILLDFRPPQGAPRHILAKAICTAGGER